jgi:type IV secretion system protein TrbL
MTPASSRALPKWALFGAMLLVSLIMGHDATAQSVIDQVMTQYSTAANTWITLLQNYAISLFWALAGIQFCWAMCSLALRGADLAEFLAE